jgi:16S rRNA pseudouridine516 synthase
MLLTNDGTLSHKLLAPKSHVTKSYGFSVRFPLSEEDIRSLEAGVDIGDYVTKPCRVELRTETEGVIFITEGKYHQIKRMMEAVNNRITSLERLTFGPLSLDPTLDRGDWRLLTEEEEKALLDATRK